MGTNTVEAPSAPANSAGSEWPAEVELILSAMDAGRDNDAYADRRTVTRIPYRVRGELRLFSDPSGTAPWMIYTRDVDRRGLGFITSHRLPLGYGGWVELAAPNGRMMKIHCTLFRCRQAVEGWFEGALYFNREQPVFAQR